MTISGVDIYEEHKLIQVQIENIHTFETNGLVD